MYGFVPSAGAVLAEWGADVIKVEHAVTGDPQRGLRQTGLLRVEGDPNPNIEHANRGKRSIGLDMSVPEGKEVLYELARRADVFLTSFLPGHRQKFGIDVDDIRAVNPKIIYARGSALGPRGEESVKGGYDMTAFWCRAGTAATITPPGMPGMIGPPGPAYGDTISGTNLAGGIAAALLKRERTGEPSVVDVSLLGSGLWSMGHTVALTKHLGQRMEALAARRARVADQSARRAVPDRRRPLHLPRDDAAHQVLGRRVPAHGPRRAGRRSAVRHRRVDRREHRGGRRDPRPRRWPSAPLPSGASGSRRCRAVGAGAGHPAGGRGRADPGQRVPRAGGRTRTGGEPGAVRRQPLRNRSGARLSPSRPTKSCWNSAWTGTASSSSRRPAPSPRSRRITCPTLLHRH